MSHFDLNPSKLSFCMHRFSWLIAEGHDSDLSFPQEGDIEWVDYPIPVEIGSGGFQKLDLALDMTLFRAKHCFQPACIGQFVPLVEITANFREMCFQVQVVSGGRIQHRELHPPAHVQFGDGLTLFRLTDKLKIVPLIETSTTTETIIIQISVTALSRLIGADLAERLFAFLGLGPGPTIVVLPIPRHVSAKLHNAVPDNLTGSARKLQCQAHVLDYFCSLIDYAGRSDTRQNIDRSARDRTRQLHDLLIQTEGRLPSLDELASRFGRPARQLNNEFAAEYGKSISAFITTHRLNDAHAAIANSNVPLKVLATRLGYSHVNHFNTAFRKIFGYPPGSLRKR